MRFLLTILLIALAAGIAEWFGPWWLAAVVAGIGGYLSGLRTGKAFLAGACGIMLLWFVFALWRDIPNGHLLSQKMAVLFFKQPLSALYIAVTVLVGALVGGMSAWAGAHLRLLLSPKAS